MSIRSKHIFEFGDFKLDVEDRRVFKGTERIALTSRDFDILLALVSSAGETVDKDVLMETIWQGTFVEEGNLNRHVSTIRKILGDDSRRQKLIKTIPKRGYRFTSDVREVVENIDSVIVENIASARIVMREETTEGFWNTPRVAIAAAMFVAVSFALAWGIFGSGTRETKAARRPEAEELYRQGRSLWNDRSADGLHNATALLEKAIEIDPDYALGHAALADAYAFDYRNWRKAEAEARRAIEIDGSLGQPHASIGFVKMFWQWDLSGANEELKRAIELDPDYATARQWYALNLAALGWRDAAVLEIGRAWQSDPASIAINTDRCRILYFAERFGEARAECEQALVLDASSQDTRELLYQIALSTGQKDEAVRRFIDLCVRSKSERIQGAANDLGNAYAKGGFDGFRTAQKSFYKTKDPSPYKLARLLSEDGDLAGAAERLNDAAFRRDFDLIFYAADPAFHPLRASSELRKVRGLPS